jgi:hypothetical protein
VNKAVAVGAVRFLPSSTLGAPAFVMNCVEEIVGLLG